MSADVGKRIVTLMQERKVSVREAAKSIRVAASTLANWRAGSPPKDFQAVLKLAKLLGVSFSYLLTGVDESRLGGVVVPRIDEVFKDGGDLFDGYAHIKIQRLIPRKKPNRD